MCGKDLCRKRAVFAMFVVLVVAPWRFLAAQTTVTTGVVRGLVSDGSGAVVPQASVVLLAFSTDQHLMRTTNDAGIFVFPSEPVGTYALEITAPGFRKRVVPKVYVQIGQTTFVNVHLLPGTGTESITVTGESPLLRTEDSNQSSVVNRELLDGLPLSGRRFLDFALLVPNSTPDGQSGLVSFAGEQGGEDTGYANGNGANSYTVDGASATSNYFGNARGGEKVPYIFGENAIEEFQVAVAPYRAEYGGAATGLVNAVTRSGSDAVHGNAFYYNRNSGTGSNDAVDKANGFPISATSERVCVARIDAGQCGGGCPAGIRTGQRIRRASRLVHDRSHLVVVPSVGIVVHHNNRSALPRRLLFEEVDQMHQEGLLIQWIRVACVAVLISLRL